MRLLLDTHVFLWYITADPKLPPAFRTSSQDPENEVYLSVASIWEAVRSTATHSTGCWSRRRYSTG
jgi:PIN domain nuclease of toxin-antitoxin system